MQGLTCCLDGAVRQTASALRPLRMVELPFPVASIDSCVGCQSSDMGIQPQVDAVPVSWA